MLGMKQNAWNKIIVDRDNVWKLFHHNIRNFVTPELDMILVFRVGNKMTSEAKLSRTVGGTI